MTEHDYPAAATELGISEDWLRQNIAKLPHRKKSLSTKGPGRVVFTDEHIAQIRAMWDRQPSEPTRSGPVTRRRAS